MSPVAVAREAVAARAAEATDPRVTVGDRAVLVDCVLPEEGRLAGVAHRPAGTFEAREASVEHLLGDAVSAPDGSVERAVGLATLNALSVPDVEWLVGDPMAVLSDGVDTVATVGLFRPAFGKFGDVTVRVVERDVRGIDPTTLPTDVSTTLFAPEDAPAAFDGADVCFVTGSTFVYGGIDAYLAAATAVPLVVVIGATASFVPAGLFDRGADVVAGARVRSLADVRHRIRAGDCGTDLHDAGLEKVYCTANTTLPGLQLPSEQANTTS